MHTFTASGKTDITAVIAAMLSSLGPLTPGSGIGGGPLYYRGRNPMGSARPEPPRADEVVPAAQLGT
jgi:hypothetical protein